MGKKKQEKGKSLTHALTHIRLRDANRSKLAELDRLAVVYKALCQQYAHHFCTIALPDKFAETVFPSVLSERWQRVAIQQAAGMAQSWRSNRQNHWEAYQSKLAAHEAWLKAHPDSQRKSPVWKEHTLPELQNICIQANVNVAKPLLAKVDDAVLKLEASKESQFDFWLQVATLTRFKPIFLPVKLSKYHREKLAQHKLNSSVQLNRRPDGSWWLTLTFDQPLPEPKPAAEVIGVDVGIANFLTTSAGEHFGTFHGKLAHRHQLDRAKRQRKAKLRACLKKNGVTNLPSTASTSGNRLSRHVKQSINRAVNQLFEQHPDCEIVMENLSVSTMRFKSKRMNATLYASQLGHLPEQIKWTAAKRGIRVTSVNPAYSSQQCSQCHHASRENRPNQRTFRCVVCGHHGHADMVASLNLAARQHDDELNACKRVEQVKKLLQARHERWRVQNGWS